MPNALIVDGYRFHFYSNENNEPPHIHVASNGNEAKFWLNPVAFVRNRGFNARELRAIERMVLANQETLESKWYEYFPIR